MYDIVLNIEYIKWPVENRYEINHLSRSIISNLLYEYTYIYITYLYKISYFLFRIILLEYVFFALCFDSDSLQMPPPGRSVGGQALEARAAAQQH